MRTIRELEAENYNWISCQCRSCHRGYVWVPFKMIRRRKPDIDGMTIAELGAKMPCGKCGSRDLAYQAARQEDAPGYTRRMP